MQKITSAATSTNMLPRLFKRIDWEGVSVNVDIGGGRFETATEYLSSQGVTNYVYDPYNRSDEHNERIWDEVIWSGNAETVTLSNVLNVIQYKKHRSEVLRQAARAIQWDGRVFITVYEGNKSGEGAKTTKGYQLNRKTAEYVAEVEKHFRDVEICKGVIVARDPRENFRD